MDTMALLGSLELIWEALVQYHNIATCIADGSSFWASFIDGETGEVVAECVEFVEVYGED